MLALTSASSCPSLAPCISSLQFIPAQIANSVFILYVLRSEFLA